MAKSGVGRREVGCRALVGEYSQSMGRLALVIFVAQVASLRTYSIYLPAAIPVWVAVPVVLAIIGVALAAWRRGILPPAWVLAAAGVVTLVIAFLVYPRADALRQVLRGSDQDDAVIAVAMGLARGEYPFATLTYLGNPVSAGPLWGLAHFPFAATGTYILAPVLALAACVAMIITRAARARRRRC